MKHLNKVALILGILVVVSPVLIWASDQRYVTYSSLRLALNEFRRVQLNDSIWELETKVKYGEASKADELKLQRQKDQLQQIKP